MTGKEKKRRGEEGGGETYAVVDHDDDGGITAGVDEAVECTVPVLRSLNLCNTVNTYNYENAIEEKRVLTDPPPWIHITTAAPFFPKTFSGTTTSRNKQSSVPWLSGGTM